MKSLQTSPMWKYEHIELWWNIHIETTPKVENNKPDIVVWDDSKKTCKIVDICAPTRYERTHIGEDKNRYIRPAYSRPYTNVPTVQVRSRPASNRSNLFGNKLLSTLSESNNR